MNEDNKISWISSVMEHPWTVGILIIGVLAIIITLAILVKKGIFRFNVKGVQGGISAESERTIVRQQIEFVKTQTETMADNLVSQFKTADEWRIRYICELIFDIWIEAVSYNNITKDSFYIQNKFEKVWAVILKETVTESFRDDKFKDVVFNECKKVVERLVDIKEYYSK